MCRYYFRYLVVGFLITVGICGPAWAQEVNFDFEDADLRAVIQAVAEFTGRNFLVDPRVQGRVTVVAPTPLSVDEAYRVFQSVLEVNGFVTVPAGGAIKIVPAEEGKLRDTGVYDVDPEANRDDMITRVLHLEHVPPERLVPILRPLVPPYGHMGADSESSSLIITDRAANVDRLVSIIDRIDRPVEQGEVEVLPLAHASAEDLAQMLSSLYDLQAERNANQAAVVVLPDTRTNSLVIKAEVEIRREIRALAQDLDSPTGTTGDTHVIYLSNADAENLVEVLEDSITGDGEAAAGGPDGGVSIRADPQTNALVVRANKSDFITIQQVVEKLDVRRLQVYVEALIAEVSTDSTRELGIQLQTAEGLREGTRGVVGGSNFNVGTSIQDVLANPLATGAGLSLGFIDGTVVLPDGTEVVNLAALARALDTQSDANVLSTPNILTMDNQEAEIVVGQNVPFVTGSYSQISQGTAVQNPFQTIERRDVGLTLRITPQITEGSAIKLEIFQEVSSVAQRGEAQDIVTNTRSLQTTVVAENDRMLVLGGLIEDDISQNEQRVPLLGDIPILGNLFRYRSNVRTKTNLLVFLRPRIVRGPADMDGPTREKYRYLQELSGRQELGREPDEQPSLENWERIVPGGQPEAEAEGEPPASGQAPEEGP